MDIAKLKQLADDPQFAGKTAAEITAALNAKTVPTVRTTARREEVSAAISREQWEALDDAGRSYLTFQMASPVVPLTLILPLFKGGLDSLSAGEPISPAEAAGIKEIVGDGHVTSAKEDASVPAPIEVVDAGIKSA